MTADEFARRIIDMTQTLYRVSFSQLSRGCDREDAVQETLRKAWEKRGGLKDDRYLQTWLIRILINECHNIQHRNSRSIPTEEPLCTDVPAQDDSTKALRDALFALEERYRMPILLHYLEGYSVEEVASVLRLPCGTIKSRMARGRSKLRELLSEEVFAQ